MIYLVLTLLFITLQGFFSGMETGMVSIMRPRAEHAAREGHIFGAKLILFFITRPEIMIATTLIGVNISVVCASLSAKQFMAGCGLHGSSGIFISTCILSVILLSCEIIPKNWFRQAPFERCRRFVWILYTAYFLLYLPVRIFAAFTKWLSRLFASGPDSPRKDGIREDFRLFLRESEGGGSVDSETADILNQAMEIPSVRMGDIMIRNDDVPAIPSSMTVRQAVDYAEAHATEKLPVYLASDPCNPPRWRAIFSLYEAMYSVDEAQWDRVSVAGCLSPLYTLDQAASLTDAIDEARRHKVQLFVVSGADGAQLGVVSPARIAGLLFES